MIHICYLNSRSSIRIYIPYKGRKLCQWLFLPTLSFLSGWWRSVSFLYSTSTSSSSIKSGWLQLDWTLYNGMASRDNQSSLCYGLAWTCCGLEFKPWDTNLHVTPAVSTKSLTYTWLPHPCLVFVRLKHSLSPCNFSTGMDPKATFNKFQKQGTAGIFMIPALRTEVNENCTWNIVWIKDISVDCLLFEKDEGRPTLV